MPVFDGHTALLVIDVQRGLFAKRIPIHRGDALLATINSLAEAARSAGAVVAYIQQSFDKQLVFGGEDWQLHPDLHPLEGDVTIHKRHGNAFQDTELHSALEARGVHRIVLTGLVTHGCVRATCLGGIALGYVVTLVADGHSSYSKDAPLLIQEWNDKLEQAGATVVPAARILT